MLPSFDRITRRSPASLIARGPDRVIAMLLMIAPLEGSLAVSPRRFVHLRQRRGGRAGREPRFLLPEVARRVKSRVERATVRQRELAHSAERRRADNPVFDFKNDARALRVVSLAGSARCLGAATKTDSKK